MCFSATASFATASVTGAAGLYSLAQARTAREMPLAAMPLLFAFQQMMEGLLWLEQVPGGIVCAGQSDTYLAFAYMLWPAYVPLAVLLLEQDTRRKQLMWFCATLGALVALHAAGWIFQAPLPLLSGHIVYPGDPQQTSLVKAAYVLAIILALAASSHAVVRRLGGLAFVGFIVSYLFYWTAFVSVWCLFAALASLSIAGHFRTAPAPRFSGAALPR